MKKVLAICNTPLQIIYAVHLRYSIYKDCEFDVIISDQMNRSEEISENAKLSECFNNVFNVKTFEYAWKVNPLDLDMKKGIKFYLNYKKTIKSYVEEHFGLNLGHDVLLFNNIDKFSDLISQYLRHKNKKCEVYMYEEGFATYLVQGQTLLRHYNKNSGIKSKIKSVLFGKTHVATALNAIYVFDPSNIKWQSPFEIKTMPKMDANNMQLVEGLNKIFGFEKMVDKYEEPIIFFEEGYRKDGYDPGDIEILKAIGEVAGKENIIVKKHPRSIDGKIQAEGFKTNVDTVIPWEIIILNHPEFAKKTFVTISSGAAVVPYLLFGMETKSVVLAEMIKEKCASWGEERNTYINYMLENIYLPNPNRFVSLKSISEIKDYFKNLEK